MRGHAWAALCAPLAFAFASTVQAQSEGTVPAGAHVVGGTIATTTIKSANVLKKVTLKDTKGATVDINPGDKIEGLVIAGATVGSAVTAGGKWKSTSSVDMRTRAAVDTISGTQLSSGALTGVKLPASAQTFKVAGKDIPSADYSSTPAFDLINVQTDQADVQKATVDPSTVTLGASTITEAGLKGDYIILRSKLKGFAPQGGTLPGTLTGGNDTCFYVSQEAERTDPANSSQKQKVATGNFKTGLFPNGIFPPWTSCPTDLGGEVQANVPYDILRDTLMESDRYRYGLTGGVLVAPFKWYWNSHNLSAGAQVGPYIGYRFRDDAASQSVLAFSIGLTSATVKTTNADGTTTSSERNGLSLAFAYLLEFKQQFSAGAMAGKDFFSKADDIPNSGKLWIGVSLGAKLK
jgi:hypothetical protein